MSTGSQPPHEPADRIVHGDGQALGTPSDIEAAVDVALRYLDDPDSLAANLPPAARLLLESITASRADDIGFDMVARVPSGDIEPPPLAQDCLAVALGLVPMEQAALAGSRLKAARQRAGLKPSEVAAGLAKAGHDVTSGEILRWEGATVIPVTASLFEAIAKLLRVTASALNASVAPAVPASLAASEQFRDLIKRWAAHTSQTLAAAQSALLQVAVAPARRGTDADDDTILAALNAYVEAHLDDQGQ